MCCLFFFRNKKGDPFVQKNAFYNDLSDTNKYIIKCCFFIFFVNGIYGMVFGSILPQLSDTYRLNDLVSGMLISSHQIGNLIAGFLAGIIPIYLGKKNSILFLSSFVVVGFLLIITTGQPWLLLVAFFFTGLSRGSISNFNNKVVNDISNSSPAASNLLHSLFAVGALISPFLVIITTKIFGVNGWRVTGIIIIVLILISQFMFSRMSIEEEKPGKEKATSKKNYEFFKNNYFLVTVVILFFYLCAEATITGFIVKYFVDSNILTVLQAQIVSSVLWLAILVGRLGCILFGHLFKKSHLLLLISVGTSVFYFFLLNVTSYSLVLFIIFGLGVSMGGIYPTAMTIAGSSIKQYPMAMGWLLILGGIGGIAMPTITGILSDRFGIFAGMAAIIVAIVIMLIGVMAYVFIERNNRATV